MIQPRIAEAVVTLTGSDGEVFTAHELKFSLTIVTPQNTITSQEILDFRTSSSKYCELKIGFRNGIKVCFSTPAVTGFAVPTQL